MTDALPTSDPLAWPLQPGTGRGRIHGTSSGTSFDRWFRYPAGFASDYVSLLLDRLALEPGMIVADCFMGSGVSGTAASTRSLSFAGIEAHPLIAELAALKLTPSAVPESIRLLSATITEAVRSDTSELAETLEGSASAHGVGDSETDLVRRSFAPEVLNLLVKVRTEVASRCEDPAAAYLKWALLGTLRDVAGVKVGWPYQRPGIARSPRHTDVLKRFAIRAAMMADDLASRPPGAAAAHLSVGDARDVEAWQRLPIAHGCVTSPPYLNNFDYADATRLELYFWGEVRSWRQMCEDVRVDMLTATTQQSSKGAKKTALENLIAVHGSVGTEIGTLTTQVETAKAARGRRSKEYDQVIPAYFEGIATVLGNLHAGLSENSTALWLIGDSAPYDVYIDTPGIIGRLAENVGFQFKEDVMLRERGNRWNRGSTAKLSERMLVLVKS